MNVSAGRRLTLVALLRAKIISQTVRTTDPNMARLLAKVETGHPMRIPLVEGQSARGFRTAFSGAAGNRGMSVETVAGEGSEEGRSAAVAKESGTGAWRSSGTVGEIAQAGRVGTGVHPTAAGNQRIVPEPVIES
jgi:hypothetical protein